jgi:hypothetical protein
MAARKINYVYVKVPQKAGEGVGILKALARAGVDLLAFTGFPGKMGTAQVDLVTDDIAGVRRVAKAQGWRLSEVKKGFLVQGKDDVGAVYRQLRRLAGMNVTAADAIAAGRGRFGMILWVKPKDYARAARALRAR